MSKEKDQMRAAPGVAMPQILFRTFWKSAVIIGVQARSLILAAEALHLRNFRRIHQIFSTRIAPS
jgi:hypothetical protein